MDKILEELKNMQEFSKRVNKNLEREVKIKERQDEVKTLYENMQLKLIGSAERETAEKKYNQKKNGLDKILEVKKTVDNDIKSDFDEQKKKIVDQIDKKVSGYVRTKQDRENAEKARAEEIEKLEKEKLAYIRIALNSKKDIDNILDKLNNGQNVSTSRLADARNEYRANARKALEVKNQADDIKSRPPFKSIEENEEEFSDLVYLRTRITNLKINEIGKISGDDFLTKYDKSKETEKDLEEKQETKTEENVHDKNAEKDSSKKTEENEHNENAKKDSNKKIDEKGENKESDAKTENKSETKQRKGVNQVNTQRKNVIVLDVSNNKINVNEESLYYKQEGKNKKQLKLDSNLAIKSYFLNDKKKMKNIDYALLSVLTKCSKTLPLEYLNVIRGGGISECGTVEESLAKIKSVVELKYKFDKGARILSDFRIKKIARAAHKLGLAELEGISEKSFFDKAKDRFSKVSLFSVRKKPKELTSGKDNIEKTKTEKENKSDVKQIREEYKVGKEVVNKTNEISREYNENEKMESIKQIVKDVNKNAKNKENNKEIEK